MVDKMSRLEVCRNPEKKRYTRHGALRACIEMSHKAGFGFRPYRCVGHWHITSDVTRVGFVK
jgi:hypothetical protein